MSNPDYSSLVERQREYFLSGSTRPAAWRKAQLQAVKALFTENHDELCEALWKDLRRNVIDADLMDVDYCVKEAEYALKHLKAWMKPASEPTPLVFQPGRILVRREPLGVALIIGAWNEPFMLTFGPLTAALAAGNTAVIKPSEIAVNCAVDGGTPGAQVLRSPRCGGGRGRRPGDHGPAGAEVGHDLLHR